MKNFNAITDCDRLEIKHSARKIFKIEKTLISLFFRPHRYHIKQNPTVTSEFVITKVNCGTDIFLDKTSAIVYLYGCVMAEL